MKKTREFTKADIEWLQASKRQFIEYVSFCHSGNLSTYDAAMSLNKVPREIQTGFTPDGLAQIK